MTLNDLLLFVDPVLLVKAVLCRARLGGSTLRLPGRLKGNDEFNGHRNNYHKLTDGRIKLLYTDTDLIVL
jgi:hypothetical protein